MKYDDIKAMIPLLTPKELSELKLLIIAQQYADTQKSVKKQIIPNPLTIKW